MRPNIQLQRRQTHLTYRWAPLAATLLPFTMGMDDQSCVSSHLPDQIVTQRTQSVSVSVRDETGESVEGEVELFVGPDDTPGRSLGVMPTQGGQATFPTVELAPGLQMFSGTTRRVLDGVEITSQIDPSLITVVEDLEPAGRQEVVFTWQSIADTRLREIATQSLTPAPSAAEVDRFVRDVKARARDLFTSLYAPFDVVLVDRPSADNTGIVTVQFEDSAPYIGYPLGTNIVSVYPLENIALGIPDFNNKRKTQTVRVLVGTIKQYLIDEGRLFNETAARPSDSLALRTRDIGIMLGRIAVHEVGHTLGLVSDKNIIRDTLPQIQQIIPSMTLQTMEGIARDAGIELPIHDLDGCQQGHNCPRFQIEHPLAKRYNDGYFVMDPGENTKPAAFIGLDYEAAPERVEKLPEFNVFCASYLAAVQPKPETADTIRRAAKTREPEQPAPLTND